MLVISLCSELPAYLSMWSVGGSQMTLDILQRSGRRAYATKSRQKWIDIRGYRVI